MSQDAAFHRQVLLGARAYAGYSKRWLFHNAPPTMAVLRPLAEWNPHGIIAHLDDPHVARAILKLGKPVVDTACALQGLGIPAVDVDHAAVAQLAADHFLTRGYRNFACFGSCTTHYSQLRLAGFREALKRAGFEVHACHVEYLPHLSERASWKSVDAQISQWLRGLAKPVAILADHDVAAHDLADTCQLLGLHVPNDVAILGVDNDRLECELAFPALSSVAIPAERIGFETAKLLERMLLGKRVQPVVVYLPPIRVVARHSTSLLAVDEPIVTASLHYIRNHIAKPLKVSDIASGVGVRRRQLEQKFRTVLGRSVLEEIHLARVELMKELLLNADLSMSDVAKQSGYPRTQCMATVFQKVTGLTPGKYRRQLLPSQWE